MLLRPSTAAGNMNDLVSVHTKYEHDATWREKQCGNCDDTLLWKGLELWPHHMNVVKVSRAAYLFASVVQQQTCPSQTFEEPWVRLLYKKALERKDDK
jgi:hypothetical protein